MFAETKMELPTSNQLIKINEIPSLKITFKAITFSIKESNNQSKNAVKVLEQLYDAIQDKSDELLLSFSEINGQLANTLKLIHRTLNCIQILGNKVIENKENINTNENDPLDTTEVIHRTLDCLPRLGNQNIETKGNIETNEDDPLDITEIKFEEHVNSFSSIKEEVNKEENYIHINNRANTFVADEQILTSNKDFVQPEKLENDKTKKEKLNCDLCDYTTSYAKLYKQHMQFKHGDKKYKCERCAYKAHRPHIIKEHMKKKHDIEDVKYLVDSKDPNIKYFLCPYCTTHPHANQKELDIHILKKHSSTNLNESVDDSNSNMETDAIRDDIYLHSDNNPDLNSFTAENQDDELDEVRDYVMDDVGVDGVDDGRNDVVDDVMDDVVTNDSLEEENMITENNKLFCDICEFSTKDQRVLEHHKGWHNGNKFRCVSCDFTGIVAGAVKEHMKINCDNEKYLIKVDNTDPDKKILLCCAFRCQFKCLSKTQMKAHVTEKHGIKEEVNEMNSVEGNKFQCNRCIYTTNKQILFDDHLKGNIKYWKCPLCDVHLKRNARKRKREHLTSNHNIEIKGDTMTCCYCDKILSNMRSFVFHLAFDHSTGVQYHCPYCDYESMNRQAFIIHTAMNHKPDQQEQPCQHCGKMFQNERKLRKHICYYHTVVKCNVCKESFDQRRKLYEHKQRVHTNSSDSTIKQEKKLYCDQCSKSFAFKHVLKAHIAAMHSTELLECDRCNYSTYNPIAFKNHKIDRHDGEANRPCPLCDFKATSAQALGVHKQAKHKTLSVKKCEVCGAKVQNLSQHMKQKHSSMPEKYICLEPDCDYKTHIQFRLKLHIEKVHENIRYPCDVCNFIGGYKGDLKRHQKIVHGGFSLKCPNCEYTTPKKYCLKEHLSKKHGVES